MRSRHAGEFMEEHTSASLRPWFSHYPPGVPHSIDEASSTTVIDILRTAAKDFADRPAAESFGVRLTYAELMKRAEEVTIGLAAARPAKGRPRRHHDAQRHGLSGGPVRRAAGRLCRRQRQPALHARANSRISSTIPARAFSSCWRISPIRCRRPCPTCGAKWPSSCAPRRPARRKGTIVNFVSRTIKRNVKAYRLPGDVCASRISCSSPSREAAAPVEITAQDAAFLQYTGGTTGRAKGAILLASQHRRQRAPVRGVAALLRGRARRPRDGDGAAALPHPRADGLLPVRRRDRRLPDCSSRIRAIFPAFVKAMKKARMTMIVRRQHARQRAAPRAADFAAGGFLAESPSWRSAAAWRQQASVAKAWKDVTGKPIIEGYGLSETSPVVCVNRLDVTEFTGAIGYPVSSTDVSIRNMEGVEVPIGEVGRDLREGSAGDGRLLEPAGRDRARDHAGRIFQEPATSAYVGQRRHGAHRRPHQGHDPRVGLQRLSERSRGRVVTQHPKVLEAAVIGQCRTRIRAKRSRPSSCPATAASRKKNCASGAARNRSPGTRYRRRIHFRADTAEDERRQVCGGNCGTRL